MDQINTKNSEVESLQKEFKDVAIPFMNEIFAGAIRLSKNTQTAEDLTAMVFEKAWRYFYQFKRGTNMRAWLYRILMNTFYNEYRRNHRQAPPVSIDQYQSDDEFYVYNKISSAAHGNHQDVAQEILSKFTEQDILKILSSLPEKYRDVVVLSDLQELSYDDIARSLDISIGTVRSRLNRGRHQLQRLLWEEGIRSGYIQDKKFNPMKRWSRNASLWRPAMMSGGYISNKFSLGRT